MCFEGSDDIVFGVVFEELVVEVDEVGVDFLFIVVGDAHHEFIEFRFFDVVHSCPSSMIFCSTYLATFKLWRETSSRSSKGELTSRGFWDLIFSSCLLNQLTRKRL